MNLTTEGGPAGGACSEHIPERRALGGLSGRVRASRFEQDHSPSRLGDRSRGPRLTSPAFWAGVNLDEDTIDYGVHAVGFLVVDRIPDHRRMVVELRSVEHRIGFLSCLSFTCFSPRLLCARVHIEESSPSISVQRESRRFDARSVRRVAVLPHRTRHGRWGCSHPG